MLTLKGVRVELRKKASATYTLVMLSCIHKETRSKQLFVVAQVLEVIW
jgi:hypothetical protein